MKNKIIVGQHYRHPRHPGTVYLGVGLSRYGRKTDSPQIYSNKQLVIISEGNFGHIVHFKTKEKPRAFSFSEFVPFNS